MPVTATARRIPATCFLLAMACLAIGGVSPGVVAAAFGCLAMGFATRRSAQDTALGLALLALLLVVSGYGIGKDLAHRDNARAAPIHAVAT